MPTYLWPSQAFIDGASVTLHRGNPPHPRLWRYACALALALTAALTPSPSPADIFRWDNGQRIPGTENIRPGPNAHLQHLPLQFANLSGFNLTGALFETSTLTSATLAGSDVTNGNFMGARLTRTNFAGAIVAGARFDEAIEFTKEQLYSTASYEQKNLQGIKLLGDRSGWDFTGQNLTNAHFGGRLTNANFSGAIVTGARLGSANSVGGLTKEQLYTTGSYQQKNLQGIYLNGELMSWDFSGQDLTGAVLDRAILTNANLSNSNLTDVYLAGASVIGANLTGAIVRNTSFFLTGLTKEQLYSTRSYAQKDLRGLHFPGNDLTGWDFSGQDLTDVWFGAPLKDANFAGAIIVGAGLTNARDFTKEQLYSTASYQQKNLQRVALSWNDLSGWDFSAQNLTDARLDSDLTNANFNDAIITGVTIFDLNGKGFTAEQLYSTASYQQKNLRGIRLGSERNVGIKDLNGWQFEGQDLTNAVLAYTTLTGANFSGANLTKTNFLYATLDEADLSRATITDGYWSFARLRKVNLAAASAVNAYLWGNDLTGANLSKTNLTSANLGNATLKDATLDDAVISRASLFATTPHGLTKEQFYSTASYREKNLQGVDLSANDLSGWDFGGQNLNGADFHGSTLTGATFSGANASGATFIQVSAKGADFSRTNLQGATFAANPYNFRNSTLENAKLSGANLRNVSFASADLTGADFTDAVIDGAYLGRPSINGFDKEDLYATASYKQKNLRGISCDMGGMASWDLHAQDLTGSRFGLMGLIDADLSGASLINVLFSLSTNPNVNFRGADLRGSRGFDLTASPFIQNTIRPDGEIRGLDLATGETLIVRDFEMSIHVTQNLQFVADSTINAIFDDPDWGSTITVTAGLTPSLAGNLKLDFSTTVSPADLIGTTFDLFDWTGVNPTGTFNVVSDYTWDTSRLYTTGEVTLIPEPAALALFLPAALLALAAALSRTKRRVNKRS